MAQRCRGEALIAVGRCGQVGSGEHALRLRRTIYSAVSATLTLGGLAGAVEAVTSYHGDDYSYDFPGHDPQGNVGTGIYGLSTCDREGDGNWVGARWRYSTSGS